MKKRDEHGRFAKASESTDSDPFTSGRTVNEATFQLSLDTRTALDRALAQAESDVRRVTR